MKKTVVLDFDGVIHSFVTKWESTTVISDPPVSGIKEAIDDIRAAGYEVIVVSARCADPAGIVAIENYLEANDIHVDCVMSDKPPAVVYVDDRAIRFDGDASTLLSQIDGFTPWNRRGHSE